MNHGFLKIIYDKKFKIARTVKYELTAENLRERYIKRDTDPFAIDPILAKSYSGLAVKPSIYEKSGYDKGHLAPAEDLSWNEEAFFQSFYMSNMAPQAAKLNQQVWRQLEDKVRDFACGEEKVTILTGALFTNNSSILSNIIVVPEEFYKIVVDETPPRKAIAFLYHQNDQDKNQLEKHIVSISDIEKRAGFSIKEDIDLNGIDSHSRPTSIASWKIAACPQKKNQVSAKKMKKKRKQKNN
ncbi:MAG: DNA/RNA non-specific endonuclease [Pseudobdellovibrionaceae bacterium]